MKNIRTITIGIAAHNEEKNIRSLLLQILQQNQQNWKFKEIIVYTDGCTDNTLKEIKAVKSEKINVIESKKQHGKCYGLNQIINNASGDYIVFFDADVTIATAYTITHLMKYAYKYTVIGGNVRPIPPQTFLQKSVYSTFLVFDESRKKMKMGNNIFGCNGGCVAVESNFAKSIHIPNIINDDDFLYFSCLQQGLLFKHVRNAIVYYKLPTTLNDYLRQLFRSNPSAVSINLDKYFGQVVKDEYKRPFRMYMAAIFKVFLKYPLETIWISMINIFSKPFYHIVTTRYKLTWHTAVSTK